VFTDKTGPESTLVKESKSKNLAEYIKIRRRWPAEFEAKKAQEAQMISHLCFLCFLKVLRAL